MNIGGTTFAVQVRPADLDTQLVSTTGCDAVEIAGMLASNPIAGIVAAAVVPFLKGKDIPSIPELATMIEEAGVIEVASDVLALYASKKQETASDE